MSVTVLSHCDPLIPEFWTIIYLYFSSIMLLSNFFGVMYIFWDLAISLNSFCCLYAWGEICISLPIYQVNSKYVINLMLWLEFYLKVEFYPVFFLIIVIDISIFVLNKATLLKSSCSSNCFNWFFVPFLKDKYIIWKYRSSST